MSEYIKMSEAIHKSSLRLVNNLKKESTPVECATAITGVITICTVGIIGAIEQLSKDVTDDRGTLLEKVEDIRCEVELINGARLGRNV